MHVNFGIPAPSGMNCSPWGPIPSGLNTNNCTSPPVFQQNPAQQFYPTHSNPQHVFQGAPIPVPDLKVLKYIPPPSRNQASVMPNNFMDGMNRYPPRPPGGTQFSPPVPPSPSTNYNNSNGTFAYSNAFNGQQNAMQDSSAHQPSNPFQSNGFASPPTNICPVSYVQPTRNQQYGRSSFSNDRYSPSPNTNLSYISQGFGNPSFNAKEQIGQSPPFVMESTQNGNKFNHHNRGVKRKSFNDSYPNRTHQFSMNQGNWQKNTPVRSRYGEMGIKSERNSEVSRPHYCDTCDRAFASEAELAHHISEHVKCDSGNCQFEAHHKIVALHKRMQHDTGYADTISKLKNAEEIEKWRAERRRRFPTKENIEKRKAELAEKEARGEVIENKDFGKFKRPNNDHMKSKKRRRGTNKTRNAVDHPHRAGPSTVDISDSESDADDSHIKLPKFLGMKHVPENENLPEDENSPEIVNLDDQSDDSAIHEVKGSKCSSKDKNAENQNAEALNAENQNAEALNAEHQNAEALNAEHQNAEALNAEHQNAENKKTGALNGGNKKAEHLKAKTPKDFHSNREYPSQPRTVSLLEKLLVDEIRHERNVIFQCVRHIVKNDFFDNVNN